MEAIVPDKTQMRRYLERGLSQQKIAEEYERETGIRVSRSAIGMAISRYGLKSARERPRHMDVLPWSINPEHRTHPDYRLLRLEGRRRKGMTLTDRELTWLGNWRTNLDELNAVIIYRPETEQGFWYIPRTDDDTDIVRRPVEA